MKASTYTLILLCLGFTIFAYLFSVWALYCGFHTHIPVLDELAENLTESNASEVVQEGL
jgi:hypothetical protein